jgi:hypothetical protein
MTQPLDLAPIQARADAATNGDWGWFDGGDYADIVADYQSTGSGSYSCRQQVARIEADWHFDDPQHADCEDVDASEQAMADADFIAHARTDVPALIAEVTRLREDLADAQARITAALAIPAATRDELEYMDPEDYQQAVGYSNALWKVQQALAAVRDTTQED